MTEAPQPRLLSTSQVATLTGATLRQLQWWDEQGHLCPQRVPSGGGMGRCRRYTVEQSGQVRLYLKLRGKGIHGPTCWGIVQRTLPHEAGGYLVIIGDVVMRRSTAEAALEAAAEWSGPVVVLRWD